MSSLTDRAVSRLREITEQPELDPERYAIVREIGRGGMGVVWEAEDLVLDRRVAVKVLATESSDAGAAARMQREARVLASLEHPGVVPLFDTGRLEDGRIWYAMRLVRGQRLDRWSAEAHGLTERLRLFVRICEPVAAAHAAGIVHRDLKPENVMVAELGSVHVMDWGLATAPGESDAAIAGTPGFMPPEQERGEMPDARSDVFALGRLLASLIAVAHVPRQLRAIIARATAVNRDARYCDARQLAEDVLRFLDQEPVAAYHENQFERAARWAAQNRVLLVLVAAYLAMRVAVYLWTRL